MDHTKKLSLVIGLIFLSSLAFGQQKWRYQRAERAYLAEDYERAIELYEKVLRDNDNVEIKEKLADSYRREGNILKAEYWYGQVVDDDKSNPSSLFFYARMLKQNGNYDEARRWFRHFGDAIDDPEIGERWAETCDFDPKLMEDSEQYSTGTLEINSEGSEISPMPYRRGLIFASSSQREYGGLQSLIRRKAYYDLYFVELEVSGKFEKPKWLRGRANSPYHDGPATFSKDGQVMYFTRSHLEINTGKLVNNSEGINKLEVLSAVETANGAWKDVQALPFNDSEYSCMHPTLSPDGNTMYFASDMPGGYGGADLYKVTKEGYKWGIPKNLGSEVNTPGDELFPYMHPDNVLFFASEGHKGLGGLDLFYATEVDEEWGNVVNMGAPINSSRDDFGISWNKNRPSGYFSSAREGGKGRDDIYTFKRKIPVKGIVISGVTKKPIADQEVAVFDVYNHETNYTTDENGEFLFYADINKEYLVKVNSEGYDPVKSRITTRNVSPVESIEHTIEVYRGSLLIGDVEDFETGASISNCKIIFKSEEREDNLTTNTEGGYTYAVESGKRYSAMFVKEGYRPEIVEINGDDYQADNQNVLKTLLKRGDELVIEGMVTSKSSGMPLSGVDLTALRENKTEAGNVESNSDGSFWMTLDPGMNYSIVATTRDNSYFTNRSAINSANLPKGSVVKVNVEMLDNKGGEVVKTIYFDYNDSRITKVAGKEVNEIFFFMRDNPDTYVDCEAHTDARGTHEYNLGLSNRRAKSVIDYIIAKGIDKKRIFAKALGETQLVNRCADGVECSDEEHQLNRRVQMIVNFIKK